ncbi:type II toxin-antitoxin system HipA family toxin [Sansalvadorimonas verongulae]|uniref:type II toxin-antitoxin system HipA family toxin n=1 Tax=Sansalvadorimonas verongulae TaxID=2172824 RepID=UPI0012BC5F75|nr:type II toxin-antitoxin system HipA family toxin [Sansalvadorimonas verongulae]MTI12307.1 type II toxin-antitoxin system HipA family toxin [Sansalvadorimonas verongulae]
MNTTMVRHLHVWRRLSDGSDVLVGELAQNRQGTFFQYEAEYLKQYQSLSPFNLPFDNSLAQAPGTPHAGLHGLFADSLPDGWGMLLMDRVFRKRGVSQHTVTPMDRLAYIGRRGTGALHYTPAMESDSESTMSEMTTLGEQAALLFDGQTDEVLQALANAGGPGGARPKALIYFDPERPQKVFTEEQGGSNQAWLIKFTSSKLDLGHDEGLCEAAWLRMAQQCDIHVPEHKLFPQSNGRNWLALKRFDCVDGAPDGRYHMQTLCGLLDADFRQPSMDYEDVIKASQILCQSPAVGRSQFVRAMFNLFAANQDDHTRNWSFLMPDTGQWQPSPMYDVTFSPTPYGEHAMSFGGYGSKPPLKAIQKLASYANYSSWKEAQKDLQKICDVLAGWPVIGKELGVMPGIRRDISTQLSRIYQENHGLLYS